MTKSKYQSSEELYLSDARHYLNILKQGLANLQLDYTRDKIIYLFCNNAIEKLDLIQKLICETKLQLPIQIATEVNRLFLTDENLGSVNVQIVNGKRSINPSAIAYLKLTICEN
jgi:hypothetical protein